MEVKNTILVQTDTSIGGNGVYFRDVLSAAKHPRHWNAWNRKDLFLRAHCGEDGTETYR